MVANARTEQQLEKEIEIFDFKKTARHEATDSKSKAVWDQYGRMFVIHGTKKQQGLYDKEKRSIRFFTMYGEPLEQIERVPELGQFNFRPRPDNLIDAKALAKL